MLRRLISSLLVGLSLIGLVGCGEAPVDVNDVKATYQEINEIVDKDLELAQISFNAQQINAQGKFEFEYTKEEKETPEFKEFGTMSLSDIEVMDNKQLKEADLLLDKILEMGTNKVKDIEEVKYSSATRETMVTIYSELIDYMRYIADRVNYLEQYKMNVNEMDSIDGGFDTIGNILITTDQDLTEELEVMLQYNEYMVCDDEIVKDFQDLQKAFHDFVVQYPKEEYPRTADSVELQKARNEINRIWEKNSMTDIRMLEGVIAPTK